MAASNGGFDRRRFLQLAGAAVASAVAPSDWVWGASSAPASAPATQSSNLPNFIIFFVDDLGWGETGAQGFAKDIPTPNIDSIAQNGVRFTNGYVTCPVCSPSRAGLLTGRYQQRYGFESLVGQNMKNTEHGLPKDERLIPQYLKDAGYATGMAGKWHLGYAKHQQPEERGFDRTFGSVVKGDRYITDVLGNEAVEFVRKNKDKPFFYYLPFTALHSPLEAPKEYLQRFAHIENKDRRTYAAMTSAMDDAIGNILQALRDNGVEDKTLIFFLGDNGGPTPQTTSSNKPLRGYKQQVFEGGIRVPFFAQWKDKFPRNVVYEKLVISLDIMATMLTAAGVVANKEKPLDGIDLVPYVNGEIDESPHQRLFWRYNKQRAIRRGDWKLMTCNNEVWLLFNLADDPYEKNDLSSKHPDIKEELLAEWKAWDSELMAPKWGGREPKLPWLESVGGFDPTTRPVAEQFL